MAPLRRRRMRGLALLSTLLILLVGGGAPSVAAEVGPRQVMDSDENSPSIAGTLWDADNQPVPRRDITITDAAGVIFTVTTDDVGRFVLVATKEKPLAFGPMLVTAVAADGTAVTRTSDLGGTTLVPSVDLHFAAAAEPSTPPPSIDPAALQSGPHNAPTTERTHILALDGDPTKTGPGAAACIAALGWLCLLLGAVLAPHSSDLGLKHRRRSQEPISVSRRQRIPASRNPSMSPSKTAVGLDVSKSVRKSLTI